MNRRSREDRTRIIAALVEGNSIRGVSRMTGFSKNTITKLLVVAIWGYKGIEEKVASTTKKATARYLNSEEGQALLTKVTEPHVQQRVKAAVENMSLSQAYPVNGSIPELTGTQRLADEYHDVEEVKNDSLNGPSKSD